MLVSVVKVVASYFAMIFAFFMGAKVVKKLIITCLLNCLLGEIVYCIGSRTCFQMWASCLNNYKLFIKYRCSSTVSFFSSIFLWPFFFFFFFLGWGVVWFFFFYFLGLFFFFFFFFCIIIKYYFWFSLICYLSQY